MTTRHFRGRGFLPGTVRRSDIWDLLLIQSPLCGSRGSPFPGCVGKDASFDIKLRVIPEDDLNHLGPVRWAGWILAIVVLIASIVCASMVIWRRNHKAVRFLQPVLLVTICVGVAILGTTLITLSFDDEIASDFQLW
eukprot:CAMPEP_0168766552 /NCGR_PEP_ID=MMETSP0725-20121227/896_1 /TAXON_ID=265536 /ORGANISM="Amphiprora sp., Strain CCMP467" /LENGTH=136 /DNA_ID=CAMNT_0008815835 /DNA_START=264 /DNA_END=671 /DNA_ORIENTATION=+